MVYLIAPWLALALPGIIGAAGSIIGRAQSRGDIARQNAYNSPANQVKRLREAGLPMAALEGGQAGTQSALPETSGEKIGESIGNYMTTSTQQLQLKLLQEEIRLKSTEADKNEAERNWLLSGRGTDAAGTNLTANLQYGQRLQGAQASGAEFASEITRMTSENMPWRLNEENRKIEAEVNNLHKAGGLLEKQIEGADLHNRIQAVKANYQQRMSNAEFINLLKTNNLLDANIEGKNVENDISKLRRAFDGATLDTRITQMNTNEWMQRLHLQEVQQKFNDYNQYQEFLRLTRNNLAGKDGYNPIKFLESVTAAAYTAVMGFTGNSPQGGQIMQGLYQHNWGN